MRRFVIGQRQGLVRVEVGPREENESGFYIPHTPLQLIAGQLVHTNLSDVARLCTTDRKFWMTSGSIITACVL